MQKLTEVLAMGGYGIYVWPSYAVATLALVAMVVSSVRALRKAQRSLRELQSTAPSAAGTDET